MIVSFFIFLLWSFLVLLSYPCHFFFLNLLIWPLFALKLLWISYFFKNDVQVQHLEEMCSPVHKTISVNRPINFKPLKNGGLCMTVKKKK